MSFYATVSSNILEKATRLFNSSVEDILNETFQNARRAGAKNIHVTTTTEGFVTVQDDGKGIASPQDVMCLGQSNWDPALMKAEDPAGMGIFSLANCGATIESNGWAIDVRPEHFSGHVAIEVRTSNITTGTRITFPIPSNRPTWEVIHKIRHAADYLPVDVYLDDSLITHTDFMKRAILIREWRGLRIGVIPSGTRYNSEPFVNFHGLVVNHDRPQVPAGLGGSNDSRSAIVDVINCPELQLILPSRKELVVNDFLAELLVECKRVIYESLKDRHHMPYKAYLMAKEIFPDITEAQPMLKYWYPEIPGANDWDDDYERDTDLKYISDDAVLLDEYDTGLQHSMARVLEDKFDIYQGDSNMVGYSWYDALTTLTLDEITIDGEPTETKDFDYGLKKAETIVLTINEIEYPTDIVLTNRCDDIRAYIRDEDADLQNIITKAIFYPNEDIYERGTEDEQRDRFIEELELEFIKLFKGADKALISQLHRAVAQVAYLTNGRIATITLEGGLVNVELQPAA